MTRVAAPQLAAGTDVDAGDYHAMHLDLITRVELAVHLEYLDAAFHPLTPLLKRAWEIEGVSPAAIGPRQRAMMSPWMVGEQGEFPTSGPI